MKILHFVFALCAITANAQLAVTILPTQVVGQKAIVSLAITNNLHESIESARAACFLFDGTGKVVGESSKWIIGGSKDQPKLAPKTGTTFNFVITSSQQFTTTNFTAQLSVSQLVLQGQKLANPKTEVEIKSVNAK